MFESGILNCRRWAILEVSNVFWICTQYCQCVSRVGLSRPIFCGGFEELEEL